MPMEQARCPECGAPIGGQNHTAVAGVSRAREMEQMETILCFDYGRKIHVFFSFPDTAHESKLKYFQTVYQASIPYPSYQGYT